MSALFKSNEAGYRCNGSGFAGAARPEGDAAVLRYIVNRRQRKHKLKFLFETPAGRVTVTGREAQTLAALIEAGSKGITALAMSSWAYRLGAYIHRLRHDYGLDIETVREAHEGGSHGRYILHTPCRFVRAGHD